MPAAPFSMDNAVMASAFTGLNAMVDAERANTQLLQSTVTSFMSANIGQMGTSIQAKGNDIIANCTLNNAQLDSVALGVGQSHSLLENTDIDGAGMVNASVGGSSIFHS